MKSFYQYVMESNLTFLKQLRRAVTDEGHQSYFEEGGCWGMALALFRRMRKLSLPATMCVSSGSMHAFVECNGKYYDWEGECKPIRPFKRVTSERELLVLARQSGKQEEQVWADEDTATEILEKITL